MLVPAFLPALLLSASVASAAHSSTGRRGHKDRSASLRRAGTAALERALNDKQTTVRRRSDKRCKVRASADSLVAGSTSASSSAAAAAPTSSSSSSDTWVAPTSTSSSEEAWVAPTTSSVAVNLAVQPTSTQQAWVEATTSSTSEWVAPTTSSAAPAASTPNSDGVVAGIVGTLLSITDGTCGWSGAVSGTSNKAGPNGAQSWLNCGVNGGGWTPPYVTLDEVVYADLATVLASGSSPFGPCADYIDQMYAVGSEMGIPPIMIASFAMQESTCNPSAVGGGGEQGLFQITKDKCGGAPGGNCQDVNFNMRTAMKYFKDTIAGNGGDLLLSIGMYNGWQKGMTYGSATAAANSGCCRCQNNLDYLHQFMNGWTQGLNGYKFGTAWNLKVCG